MATTRILSFCSVLFVVWATQALGPQESEARWWRGNTHTHTLWSDGRAAPEFVAAWYKDNGYDFLVLSDHNTLQETERWFPVSEDGSRRLTPEELAGLIEQFGEDQVDLRQANDRREMRLKTLAELRSAFEEESEFLFIQGEEVTSHFRTADDPPRNKAVHINAVNISNYVPPRGGDSVVDLMNKTMEAIEADSKVSGRPVFAHLNHPNLSWSITWQEVAQMRFERFFEVYNGHRGSRSEGNEEYASTESMWDQALAMRLRELNLGLLYGVAVDDAHDYYGTMTSTPGRGWVMVRSKALDADSIVAAMKRGDFYSSTGVTLKSVETAGEAYKLEIEPDEGVTYSTSFIGTRSGENSEPGEVLATVEGLEPSYRYQGNELYVRARVISTRVHPNPYRQGDMEEAWTQPHRPQ